MAIMVPPIFLISLSRSPRYSRAQQFVAETSLPITLFSGVDGAELDLSRDRLFVRGYVVTHDKDVSRAWHRRLLTPGEAGCSLSHLMLYHMCREQNLPAMMILEDDFQFLASEGRIVEILSKLPDPDTFDLCYLQSGTHTPYQRENTISEEYFTTSRPPNRTHGYIVTQRFVRKACDEFTLHSAADGYLTYFCKRHPDTTILVSEERCVGLSNYAAQSDTWILDFSRSASRVLGAGES